MAWLILFRVALSVSASAVQKRLLLNRAGVYHTWILTYSIILGPAVLLALANPGPTGTRFWGDIALGGALDAAGNLAMVAALRITDLSVFGPLNALRPILALAFGWLFLGEVPTSLGLLGVAITVAGCVILFAEPANPGRRTHVEIVWPLFLRIAGLALGVVGAVFLKRAALQSSAEVTVASWVAFGLMVLAGAAAIHRPRNLRALGSSAQLHARWLLTHAAIFLTMQWCTIRIFQETLLAYAFVYFQLGMVLQVFIGRVVFKEGAFVRRLLAAAIMALGSILVLWKG